jgi:hypothetical protein
MQTSPPAAAQRGDDGAMFGYESPPETPTLHRDVFRWVQSLDLQHSLKNVRRWASSWPPAAHRMRHLCAAEALFADAPSPGAAPARPPHLPGCRDAANGYLVAQIFNRYFPVGPMGGTWRARGYVPRSPH